MHSLLASRHCRPQEQGLGLGTLYLHVKTNEQDARMHIVGLRNLGKSDQQIVKLGSDKNSPSLSPWSALHDSGMSRLSPGNPQTGIPVNFGVLHSVAAHQIGK